MKTLHPIIVLFALIFLSCASIDRMIDQGRYDEALTKAVRKLSGKKKYQHRHVIALERAFTKATQRYMQQIKMWEHSDKIDDWAAIINTYDHIIHRQEMVKALLPVFSDQGYHAKFLFVQAPALRKKAVEDFLDMAYVQATNYLKNGTNGDKVAARRAHALFDKLWKYTDQYRDAYELQVRSQDLGMERIEVQLVSEIHPELPVDMRQKLLNETFVDKKWTKYHFTKLDQPADRMITLILHELIIGPERWIEKQYVDQKEIEVGFEYVLDQNGNVAKDSLGNDIKLPVYRNIIAKVRKVKQQKVATLFGEILISDHQHHRVTIPLQSKIVFEHKGAAFKGDSRALTPESRKWIDQGLLPFPDDGTMFYDAVVNFGELAKRKLKKWPLQNT